MPRLLEVILDPGNGRRNFAVTNAGLTMPAKVRGGGNRVGMEQGFLFAVAESLGPAKG
jgi:hypothetical protein